jgi:hypothetical protein
MDYGIVAFPAAPVRKKPAHQSEMVSQLLFGEPVKILKYKKDLWVKIRSLHDDYEGWLTHSLLAEVDEKTASSPVTFVTTGLLNAIEVNGSTMYIPAGSSLPAFEYSGGKNSRGQAGAISYTYTGTFTDRKSIAPCAELLHKLCQPWLNVPYLWGGRSPLGVDCSGFVQVIFRQMGIDLPRDAWQQAQSGMPVKKFSEAGTGDLAFFDNREDIVHVGIITNPGELMHASGKVKIDTLSKKGIQSADPRAKVLRLRAIRRMW